MLVFTIFATYERRTESLGGSPLVEPSVFRRRAFSGSLVVAQTFFAAMSGFLLPHRARPEHAEVLLAQATEAEAVSVRAYES